MRPHVSVRVQGEIKNKINEMSTLVKYSKKKFQVILNK